MMKVIIAMEMSLGCLLFQDGEKEQHKDMPEPAYLESESKFNIMTEANMENTNPMILTLTRGLLIGSF